MAIAKQIFSCLHFLHQFHLVSRDLRLDTLYLYEGTNGNLCIKLIDLSLLLDVSCKQQVLQRVGNRFYMAPEILKREHYDTKSDVWAATVIIYCLLTGKMPFNGKSKDDILKSIESINWDKEFRQPKWNKFSSHCKSFLRVGLQIDCN